MILFVLGMSAGVLIGAFALALGQAAKRGDRALESEEWLIQYGRDKALDAARRQLNRRS